MLLIRLFDDFFTSSIRNLLMYERSQINSLSDLVCFRYSYSLNSAITLKTITDTNALC